MPEQESAHPDDAVGRRERKKERTRRALVDTAVALFFERGFEATTVEEIAKRLDLSVRTVFRYFESKEDILTERIFRNAASFGEIAASQPAGLPALTVARNAAFEVARRREADPNGLRETSMVISSPVLSRRLSVARELWTDALASTLESRLDGPDAAIEARVIAASTVYVLGVAFDTWVREEGRRPLETILTLAFALDDRARARDGTP